LPLSTRIALSQKRTAVGYQPVGTKPWNRLSPARVTSTTATVLLSAFATSSVAPSGESASALGVAPGGAFGESAMAMRSATRRVARSIAHTAFVLAHATNSVRASLEKAIAFGCSPTVTSAVTASVRGSSASTRAPPQTDTYTAPPSGAGRTAYASAASVARASTRPLSTSTAATPLP
jgi:hypothetical protein